MHVYLKKKQKQIQFNWAVKLPYSEKNVKFIIFLNKLQSGLHAKDLLLFSI